MVKLALLIGEENRKFDSGSMLERKVEKLAMPIGPSRVVQIKS